MKASLQKLEDYLAGLRQCNVSELILDRNSSIIRDFLNSVRQDAEPNPSSDWAKVYAKMDK